MGFLVPVSISDVGINGVAKSLPLNKSLWSYFSYCYTTPSLHLHIYFFVSFLSITRGNISNTPNLPVHSIQIHTLFLSSWLSQLSRNARMLTSFPPLLSEVGEERGEDWEEGAAADCTGFVGVGNFSFSSRRPALPVFVHSTMPSLLRLPLLWLLLFALFLILCILKGQSQNTMDDQVF